MTTTRPDTAGAQASAGSAVEPVDEDRPRGWLRRLRDLAPGARTLKTALAVGIAWWLATGFGEQRPLFAAISALVIMQATIAGTLRRMGLQLVGILGGLILAFLIGRFLGLSAVGIGLAVLLGLWLGRQVGSPDRVGVELGVTALLVVGLGADNPELGFDRLWETALGGVVAAAINVLVLPPNYVGQLGKDLERLATGVSRGLREATRIFVERPEHEGAAEVLDEMRELRATLPGLEGSLRLAGTALRYSPLRRGSRPVLERYRLAEQLFSRAAHHTTTLARIVQQHAERPHDWPHSGLNAPAELTQVAEQISLALVRYLAYARGDEARLADVRAAVARAEASLANFLKIVQAERAAETAVQRLVDIAAVASELEHLVADLRERVRG